MDIFYPLPGQFFQKRGGNSHDIATAIMRHLLTTQNCNALHN